MAAPPTGTITFFLTDIAGSSARFEQYAEVMHRALACHDRLLRESIGRHEGHLFKTWGDAFLAVFSDAEEAVAAALEAQIALRQTSEAEAVGSLPVRMALHTGPAEYRDGDYFGDTLNRASRLLRVAHGGQILLSGATADLVGTSLPDDSRLVDLGLHRLRDLQHAERVYTLQHPGLPSSLPPLLSLEQMPTNLPQQFTSFVGREREIAEAKRLLASTRLLTLTGPGGSGKTRLALQVAVEALDDYPDGVWIAELASLRDPSLVPRAVCTALRLPEETGRDALSALTGWVRTRRLLLVLDNCEHLVDAAAALSDTVLKNGPLLRILTTSRERLQIGGETVWSVPALVLPGPNIHSAREVDAALRTESVRLFQDRAKSVQPGFLVTRANLPAVVEICRRLDGIPLAIELAAALSSVMQPEEIAGNLGDFFRILTRGSRNAMEHHQTLHGAIQWSFDLLTPTEQMLFRRLAVFRGGWTLAAAQQICSAEHFGGIDVLENQVRLVDKSLVFRDDTLSGESRFRMLESVRQFAWERLEEAGEASAVSEAHRVCFQELVQEAEPQLQGPDQKRFLDQLERENDNLREALTGEGRSDRKLRMVVGLHRFWLVRGYLAEGRKWLEETLGEGDAPATDFHSKAYNAAGILSWAQGDVPAAKEYFSRALEIGRNLNAHMLLPGPLNNLAMLETEVNEYAHARELFEEALSIYKEAGDKQRAGTVLNNLGVLLLNLKDYDAARSCLDEALEVHVSLGDRGNIAVCEANLARLEVDTGDSQGAREHARRCLQYRLELGDLRGVAAINFILALADIREGNYVEAVRRIAGTDALRNRLGVVPPPVETKEVEDALETCRRHLHPDTFDHAWSNGVSFSGLQA